MFAIFSGEKGVGGPKVSASARALSKAAPPAASAAAKASFKNSRRGVTDITLRQSLRAPLLEEALYQSLGRFLAPQQTDGEGSASLHGIAGLAYPAAPHKSTFRSLYEGLLTQ